MLPELSSNKTPKKENKIHDPIKGQKVMLFKNTGKKVLVHQQQKQNVIVINTNIYEHFWRIQQKMRGLSTSKTHLLFPWDQFL